MQRFDRSIGSLQDPVTWYRVNYAGKQVTQWDFQNKGTPTSPAQLSFVLKVSQCNLRPSIINSVPCDRIVQKACWKDGEVQYLDAVRNFWGAGASLLGKRQ